MVFNQSPTNEQCDYLSALAVQNVSEKLMAIIGMRLIVSGNA